MKKNKKNLRKKGSIVNRIASQHLVQKWDLPKKPLVVHTKIVIFDKKEKISIINSLGNLQPLWAEENLRKKNLRKKNKIIN